MSSLSLTVVGAETDNGSRYTNVEFREPIKSIKLYGYEKYQVFGFRNIREEFSVVPRDFIEDISNDTMNFIEFKKNKTYLSINSIEETIENN
jgi:hypothetical protein